MGGPQTGFNGGPWAAPRLPRELPEYPLGCPQRPRGTVARISSSFGLVSMRQLRPTGARLGLSRATGMPLRRNASSCPSFSAKPNSISTVEFLHAEKDQPAPHFLLVLVRSAQPIFCARGCKELHKPSDLGGQPPRLGAHDPGAGLESTGSAPALTARR